MTLWAMGMLPVVHIMLHASILSSSNGDSSSVYGVTKFMTNFAWMLLNLLIKIEIWKGPEKVAELLSKLHALEGQLLSQRVRIHWSFKVRLKC